AHLACVVKGALQERFADPASLMAWRHEQLGKKPEAVANPAERETDDFAIEVRHPQAVPIIAERERLKLRRADACHRTEAVTHAEVVDAADDKRLGRLQLFSAGRPVVGLHGRLIPRNHGTSSIDSLFAGTSAGDWLALVNPASNQHACLSG